MATRTVARLFDNYDDAAHAVRDLEASGIPVEDISLVANNAEDRIFGADSAGAEAGGAEAGGAEAGGNEAGPGAEVGAGIGAVAGGGAGVLAGLGMLAIPGIGPVVAAGWLIALAAGAVGGAVAGGLIGGLVGAGIGKDTAEVYAEGVRRGGTLVSARVPEERAPMVEAVLERHRTVDPARRREEYASAGWTGYDPSAPAYPFGDAGEEQRTGI